MAPPNPARAAALRLHRLKHDISEFLDQPYPGVEILVQDEKYDNLCLILTPQSGPLVGLRLHFDFELPEDWPQSPPKVRCSYPSGLNHPNVYGSYICCDLLNMYADQQGYRGYTPAFTLRALCMQLLSFFSSPRVDQEYGGSYDMGDEFLITYFSEEVVPGKMDDLKFFLDENVFGYGAYRTYNPVLTESTETFKKYLDSRKSNRTYVYVEDSASDCPPTFKAGSWAGWQNNESVMREVEVTRLSPGVRIPGLERLVRVRYRNRVWYNSYEKMRAWTGCSKCHYHQPGGSNLVEGRLMITLKNAVQQMDGAVWDRNPDLSANDTTKEDTVLPPGSCQITRLGPDLLLQLADHLPTEALNSLASVLPPFKKVVEHYHVQLYRDIQCFFLRKGINSLAVDARYGKTILGIGVGLEGRDFRSSFDWLSLEAFELHKVRCGIDKSPFEFFLPLVFSEAHFQRAYPKIWQCINAMAGQTRSSSHLDISAYPNTSNPGNIQVIYKFMNNIIVSLMKACDDVLLRKMNDPDSHGFSHTGSSTQLLQASEKSITAYCQLFYLMICLTRRVPMIRKQAFEALDKFRLSPKARSKQAVPDLGQLIVQLCIVNGTVDVDHPNPLFHRAFSWRDHIISPYLHETMVRNVRWILKDDPSLAHFSDSTRGVDYRLQQTLKYSKTSQRLVMFQTFFLRFIVQNHLKHPEQLATNFGFPPEGVADAVVKEIKKIYAVNGWRAYFSYIGYERGLTWDKEKMCEMLKGCLTESREKGYHDNPGRGQARQFWRD